MAFPITCSVCGPVMMRARPFRCRLAQISGTSSTAPLPIATMRGSSIHLDPTNILTSEKQAKM